LRLWRGRKARRQDEKKHDNRNFQSYSRNGSTGNINENTFEDIALTLQRWVKMIDIFSQTNFDNHEQVIFVTDAIADLFGIIAIHNTTLGPAAGGCRMQYTYTGC
jgi:hypothetical protein